MTSPDVSKEPVLFGRYRVHTMLGESRLATVYKATDLRLQRPVLIHLLRKELCTNLRKREQFLTEAKQSARRSHPVFLEVFDSGESNSRPFLITEAVDGRPLLGVGALSVEQALAIVRQVAEAVALCQSHRSSESPLGLFHPPISSANLLLVGDDQVKLVDSWFFAPELIPADLAHYRAPELSRGQEPQLSSVVYALGILLFELITGQRPIHGDGAQSTALAHLTQTVPSLARVRPTMYVPSLDRLIARATSHDPVHRFADAQSFVTAINDLWRELTVSTRRLNVEPVRTSGRPAVGGSTYHQTPSDAKSVQVAPVVRSPMPTSSLRNRVSQVFTGSFDIDSLRRQHWSRTVGGMLVMIMLLLGVAALSFWGVTWIVQRLGFGTASQLPDVPSWSLPDFNWPGRAPPELYVVNIAEGLNLRSEPSARSDTIMTVVPNGVVVRKLEGPVIADNIPWLKVRVELNGQSIEGWMSLNYLRPQP
ncbi:MAG: ligand-binding protein SH3 [Chloroflexus sp.]|uniref:serine/threonine protein kinase n=1 Tax=Chloroflexus sp. TaxID=1904827 RepID=UPI0021DBBA1F|nr:serine/threonine protein kinase [Chloroflexus sp.]GIV90671.1 MAG: ligand-binding protein SH3 [Chloroflexus sp.]